MLGVTRLNHSTDQPRLSADRTQHSEIDRGNHCDHAAVIACRVDGAGRHLEISMIWQHQRGPAPAQTLSADDSQSASSPQAAPTALDQEAEGCVKSRRRSAKPIRRIPNDRRAAAGGGDARSVG